MSSPKHHIEIVGGGLAGLSLGLALRRAGVPVTVYEAGDYPRHRVCGEFIVGLDDTTIGRLELTPLLADARRHRSVAWFDRQAFIREQTLPAPALGLSRHVLDARLAAAFVAAGGDLRTKSRVDCAPAPPGRVFSSGRRRNGTGLLGLKVHVRGLALARDLELHLGEGAYVGLAGVENGAVNLCGLFRHRTGLAPTGSREHQPANLLFAYLAAAGLDALGARLRDAEIEADSFCAIAAVDFAGAPVPSGRIRLGDAYAMIPPFTGNGMAMAFQSAHLALDSLLAYSRDGRSWSEAVQLVAERLHRRFRLRLGCANALQPFLFEARRQRWLISAHRAGVLPLRPLYRLTH
jgi:2-polyprenyl-6-methoxyphenol hydroxylase-like FAD-dependent oxidoreductase